MGADLYAGRRYFRDPYSPSSILWAMGMSWWRDVLPLVDADQILAPAVAARLADRIEACPVAWRDWATYRAHLDRWPEETVRFTEGVYRSFLRRDLDRDRAQLLAILRCGKPVRCSL